MLKILKCWNRRQLDKNIIFIKCMKRIWFWNRRIDYIYIFINIINVNRITKLQFVFWNRDFKQLVWEIRPLDFPETATVGFALEISFQRHQLCKDPTVGLSGMFNSNLKKNNTKIDYIYIIKINRITMLYFIFWNRKFKRLYREIGPSDFPKTETVGFVLKRSF